MRVFAVHCALPLALGLACLPTAAQPQHDHVHVERVASAVHPVGQRWTADDDLHAGMGRFRTAVDELRHHEMGHMGEARAAALADGIGRDVAWIVAHCKLAPAADAALHPLIAKLAANAAMLKADPSNLSAIPPMREALAEYARLFDDPAGAGDPTPVDEPEERRD